VGRGGAEQGTRIVGPNGMNIVSVPDRLNLSAIVPFPEGKLGFLSASGNLGYALAHEAPRHHVGFSRFVSTGNQADLALDEYLDYFRQDPETEVVLVYLEGLKAGRARAFLEALARTAAEKPVLVLRGGRTAPGSGTARSHTGALAGEGEVTRQALLQAGAVLLRGADEALPIARAFLASPLPQGPKVLLVGEGGGHATLLTDAAFEEGLDVHPLPPERVAALRPGLPPFVGIVSNPVEFGGMSEYDLRVYERVLDPLFGWEGCDQALLFGGYALYDLPLVRFLAEKRKATGKPVLLHDLHADEDRPALAALRAFPLYASVEVMARCAGALAAGAKARGRAARAAALPERVAGEVPEPLRRVFGPAGSSGALVEEDASMLLRAFGVPVLPSALARDPDEAADAARRLGFPVVLKVHAAEIVHKSDRGGVHLDLRTEEDVRKAYASLQGLVPKGALEVRLTPFRPGGLEALLGARRDPQFGDVVLLGFGGILAESMKGAAIRTLPCHPDEVTAMIEETGLLEASKARGRGGVPESSLALAISGLERLLASAQAIEDVEINPLRLSPEGCVALDARVLLRA
jgi:acetyltransferase